MKKLLGYPIFSQLDAKKSFGNLFIYLYFYFAAKENPEIFFT